MANTTFIDKQTIIQASWLNSLNHLKYEIFDGADTKQEACEAIGAIRVEGEPEENQVPQWDGEKWIPADVGGGGEITNPLVIDENTPGGGPRAIHLMIEGRGVAIVMNTAGEDVYLSLYLIEDGVRASEHSFQFDVVHRLARVQGDTGDWIVEKAL